MAGHNDRLDRYEYLKDMSIKELEELLLASESLHPDDEDEFIGAITDEIVRKEKQSPTGRIPGTEEAWCEFQTYYNTPEGKGMSLFPDEEDEDEAPKLVAKPTEKRKKKQFRLRGLVAAAVIVLCVATVLPTALGYESFVAMIGHWNDTVFHFVMPNQEEKNPSETVDGEFGSLEEALEANGVTALVAPVISSEFEFVVAEVTQFPEYERIDYNALYTSGDRNISVYIIQREEPVKARSYEKDGTLVDVYTVHDVDHYIYENNGKISAIWYTGAFECSLRADVTSDEVKSLINSIYER